MKRFFFKIIFILPVVFYSCDVPLNPNAPFRQRYALTGIMRNDASVQLITLTKSYQPSDGLNPLSNTNDPAVIGAEVNMWYRDTLYELRDTTILRTDTSQYKDSVHCYYVNNLQPQPGEYIDIEAVLPNGLLLQSTTKLPDVQSYGFFSSQDDRTIPPADGRNYIYIGWEQIPNILYHPRVVITYYVKGSTEKREKEVPLYYDNGNSTPIYPAQTKVTFFTIDLATINRALNEIPEGNNDKLQYTIANIDVQMIVYDENLTTYYSSIQTGVDAFTVRLDQPDYSDITGGFGIFGSFVRTDFYIKFTAEYLKALGYY
ncbi:MAG: DUF4249 domain-containing protein [Bacteroidetes bacterium]|nr:DUF4249 domain-containing protein [Bacteroidota bacterium]